MYRHINIYKTIESETVVRYVILEKIPEMEFFVLHADFLRLGENNEDYFRKLTLERLLDISQQKIPWEKSIEEAILMHDKQFEN
ncbi:MAG: hypothetical protein FD163_2172 [Hyphomonadaceae bacterium]|nr:MAG: hypothetical protein FD128_2567 [Hyphomonadaceae bacterium]KAF0183452.1 MAG: hypothetical protein FD163_2172 [Hyphomonadaceae bacterium]